MRAGVVEYLRSEVLICAIECEKRRGFFLAGGLASLV